MNYDQAMELLKTIEEVYLDKFPLSKRKVEAWLNQLENMDYQRVMDRLSQHMTESPFPPSLSDIAVYKSPDNGYLKKMKQWDKEAAEVPESTKVLFEAMMDDLIRKVSKDD